MLTIEKSDIHNFMLTNGHGTGSFTSSLDVIAEEITRNYGPIAGEIADGVLEDIQFINCSEEEEKSLVSMVAALFLGDTAEDMLRNDD